MWKLLRNFALAVLLAAGALKLLANHAAGDQARRLAELLAPHVQLRWDTVSGSLGGDVALAGVSIAPANGHRTYRADRAVLRTPGLTWLLQHGWLQQSPMPSHGAIELEGLVLPPEPGLDARWFDVAHMVAFAAPGCATGLGPQDWRQLGGATPSPTTQQLKFDFDAARHALDLRLAIESPGFSSITLEAQLSNFDVAKWDKPALRDAVRLQQVSATYADAGFFARRNAFCARRNGQSTAQFVDAHVQGVIDLLKQGGIEPGQDIVQVYRMLVAQGGRASVLSLPSKDLDYGAWQVDSPEERLRQLNMTARYQDRPPVMLRLAFAREDKAPALVVVAAAPPDASVAQAAVPPPTLAPPPRPGASPAQAAPQPASVAAAPPAPLVVIAHPPVEQQLRVPVPHALPANEGAQNAPTVVSPPLRAPERADASAHAPPANSTLALIWKPGIVEPLPEAAPLQHDYEVVAFAQLPQLAGQRVRLVKRGRDAIEGYVVSADANAVTLRVRRGGGDAQFSLPRSRIDEVQVLRR